MWHLVVEEGCEGVHEAGQQQRGEAGQTQEQVTRGADVLAHHHQHHHHRHHQFIIIIIVMINVLHETWS